MLEHSLLNKKYIPPLFNDPDPLTIARATLRIETETLRGLHDALDERFSEVVHAVRRSPGRLVVTGIGKSALVGQKIVATLNSTGTPALFLHAADAIHGDLGMVRPEDTVLALSKSGETAEVRVLAALVKNLGNVLIGMTTSADSYLGQQSDHLLLVPVPREADPNNLAPTASTTAQMAMGDALAVALLAQRGFTPQDFAQFHPGGSLGKQLYLRVRDLYPRNERPAVPPTATVRETILEMTSKRLGCTVVVDPNGHPTGIITDGDLRRMLERETDTRHLTARDLASPHPRTIAPEELAIHALRRMREGSITQLVVAQPDGQYLGIVHLHDLVREGLV